LFDQAALDNYGAMMAITAQEEELVVKPPGKYKKDTKWKNFKEGAIAYLNALKGKYDIPLAYVIREDEQPVPDQIFQSEHHRLIAVTPLQGIEFKEDNGRIFNLLKSWTINGHAWTWMRSFNSTRNSRQAWLALVGHFKGDAQRDKVKDHAYATIAAAKYYGEKKSFTFETYVTIRQEAYTDLVQYGKVISEEKRVRDLLSNIRDNSAATNVAKGTILEMPTLRNNFSNAVAHLSTTLQLGQSLQENNHNISSTNTNKGDGRGGRNIYLGSYSPEQWRKLTAEEKKRVYDGRQKSAEQHLQDSNNNQRSRQVAATAVDGQTTIAALSTGDSTAKMDQAILHGALEGSAAIGEKRSNTDNAGSQMSRRRTSAINTSNRVKDRNISRTVYQRHYDHTTTISGRCELDSHTDTCIAGENCIVLEYTDQTVNVSAFSDRHKPLENVPIVTATTEYDS
jgi:predicted metallo-beta-lactamase superfamily hydrolase